ncbi:tetratricopeptide repeat protein [Streptomyces sp. NPDC048665]|uniref:tetratricopeptide repeat protein n=1 Tax=Streptomyces sp. NPDC048665 TaxID=3155490 RepID=UPI003418BE10
MLPSWRCPARAGGIEAAAEYDALLPVFGRIFGAEHPQTLKLRSNRAQHLATLGRHIECEVECAAVIQIATRGQGANMSLITTVARSGLVYALNGQGRHEEALAEAERADEVRRGLPEEWRRTSTGAVELSMAAALLGLGRVAQARTLAVAAHDACVSLFGPNHYRTAEALAFLDSVDGV